jgi:hypothetical protein
MDMDKYCSENCVSLLSTFGRKNLFGLLHSTGTRWQHTSVWVTVEDFVLYMEGCIEHIDIRKYRDVIIPLDCDRPRLDT